jgi:cation transport ATPase
LDPEIVANEKENIDLVSMTRRFWVSAVMSMSSISVISNALRLRKVKL